MLFLPNRQADARQGTFILDNCLNEPNLALRSGRIIHNVKTRAFKMPSKGDGVMASLRAEKYGGLLHTEVLGPLTQFLYVIDCFVSQPWPTSTSTAYYIDES